MTDEPTSQADRFVTSVRWSARLLGLAVLGLYLTIFVGEGGFNPGRLSPAESSQMLSFLGSCLGLLVAWSWEGFGGTLTLAGLALFYANEHRLTGRFPRGSGFAVMTVPAVLFLAAAAIRTCRPGLGAGAKGGFGP
jgi:hypothetical protein